MGREDETEGHRNDGCSRGVHGRDDRGNRWRDGQLGHGCWRSVRSVFRLRRRRMEPDAARKGSNRLCQRRNGLSIRIEGGPTIAPNSQAFGAEWLRMLFGVDHECSLLLSAISPTLSSLPLSTVAVALTMIEFTRRSRCCGQAARTRAMKHGLDLNECNVLARCLCNAR